MFPVVIGEQCIAVITSCKYYYHEVDILLKAVSLGTSLATTERRKWKGCHFQVAHNS